MSRRFVWDRYFTNSVPQQRMSTLWQWHVLRRRGDRGSQGSEQQWSSRCHHGSSACLSHCRCKGEGPSACPPTPVLRTLQNGAQQGWGKPGRDGSGSRKLALGAIDISLAGVEPQLGLPLLSSSYQPLQKEKTLGEGSLVRN